jgi:hypothetical protein
LQQKVKNQQEVIKLKDDEIASLKASQQVDV